MKQHSPYRLLSFRKATMAEDLAGVDFWVEIAHPEGHTLKRGIQLKSSSQAFPPEAERLPGVIYVALNGKKNFYDGLSRKIQMSIK